MAIPKFLLADHSDHEDVYVLHTEYPRFLLNIHTDAVEWFDEIDDKDDELETQIKEIFDDAFAFYDDEITAYDDMDFEEE